MATVPGTRVDPMNRRLQHLEAIIVFAIIAAAFYPGLSQLPFHVDESHWIGLSAPFEAFVSGRFRDPVWQERQDKAINGTVTFYVIGAARRIGGIPADRLNPPWRWSATADANIAEGRMPEPRLLWWGRAGVTTMAVVALFLFFLLLWRAAGRFAAYAWLALVLVNPYLRDTLRHAMNEGVLLSFVALATWATSRALPHLERAAGAPGAGRAAMAWLVAAAVAAGLAAQTKLNGGLIGPGIVLAAVLAVRRSPMPWRARLRRIVLASALIAAVSCIVFVGSNPSIWPDPIRGTVRSVRARAEVTRAQMQAADGRRLSGTPGRVGIVLTRVFTDYALVPLKVAGPLLFLAGTGSAVAGFLLWMRRANHNHALVSLLAVGVMVAAPMLLTPLDRPRFYMLPVFFAGLATAAGLAWLARRAWHALSARQAGR